MNSFSSVYCRICSLMLALKHTAKSVKLRISFRRREFSFAETCALRREGSCCWILALEDFLSLRANPKFKASRVMNLKGIQTMT